MVFVHIPSSPCKRYIVKLRDTPRDHRLYPHYRSDAAADVTHNDATGPGMLKGACTYRVDVDWLQRLHVDIDVVLDDGRHRHLND